MGIFTKNKNISMLEKRVDLLEEQIKYFFSNSTSSVTESDKISKLEEDIKNKDNLIQSLNRQIDNLKKDLKTLSKNTNVLNEDTLSIEYVGLDVVATNLTPVEIVIEGSVIKVNSWKSVYRSFVKYAKDNLPNFHLAIGTEIKIGKTSKVIISKNKDDVTVIYPAKDGSGIDNIYSPFTITGGLYLESPALSSYAIVQRINALCDVINLPKESVKIGIINI